MKTPLLRLAFLFFAGFAFARAAITPADERTPFTAKELAQGYREHVILARPHAARRATADAEEVRDGVHVREKFARFGELRVIELDDADSADRAIARLAATGRYEFVEPDLLRHADVTPNDIAFLTQWAMNNTGISAGVAGADIKAVAAWDILHDAPNVIVAVVDSGVNLNHQDLVANLWTNPAPTFGDLHGASYINGVRTGVPTDDLGHGTHVAGIIGAAGNNSLAVCGVAWKVQIMPVKFLGSSGTGTISDEVNAINYALAHGAQIINASFGESGGSGFSQSELAVISATNVAGVLFVAAAGNDAANLDLARHYPGSYPFDNLVTVGSSTRRDELSTFSNYGAAVDLFAPGEDIISLDYATPNGGTVSKSGTSMAAPHVAGVLALLRAQFPNDSYRQLVNRLLRSVDQGVRFAGKTQSSGRLNLLKALTSSDNRPFNDDFATRARVAGDNLAIRSSNTGATAESSEPAHAGFTATSTLWWEWVAPTTANVSIDTSGSGYDTVLAVYTGTSVGGLVSVAANDNDGVNQTSRVTFTAQAGTAYEIAVGGKAGATGLTLVNVGSTPANDAFATPATLTGESTHVTATNSHCSRETGEPRILGFTGGTSLWYRWTAPRSGRFQVAAVSADFDPLLAVYTGTAITALTLVDASDNTGAAAAQTSSLCTINATAGATYLITVDSKSASAVGSFTLSLTDSLWQAATGGAITGAPAVAPDGTIYAGSIDHSLYAFAPDGTQKWSGATGGLIDTCSPAVAPDGTVYVGSNDGKLYAFAPDGSPKWSHTFITAGVTFTVSNSPSLAADGTIYVKPSDGFLYALDPADGSTKWSFNVHAPVSYASASIAPDGTIYQGSEDKNLYALRPDGTLKWTFTGDNDIYTAPAIDAAGNLYFTVLNTGKLFSVTSAGAPRWSYSGASLGSSSAPALSADGGTVFFGGYDHKLHAVNTATGAARWTFTLADEIRASSPAVDANGVIYIGCYDFKLYAINPDGSLKRTYDMGNWLRSCPAISGTSLYVGSNDGKLYAFDLGAAAAPGPWPQYRANPRRLGRAVADATLTIVTAPQPQTAVAGSTVQLTVAATGPAPLTYQWFKDGAALSGETSATLTLASATAANSGKYSVVVSSPVGNTPSTPVAVTIEAPNPGRLMNLSARADIAGGQELVVGFALRSGGPKPMLIRGVGPTLTVFSIASPLADPVITLYGPDTNTRLFVNDDWGFPSFAATDIAAAATRVGAFALPAGSKDAGIFLSLGIGNYTAIVARSLTPPVLSPTVAIALAELYDADSTPLGAQTLIPVSRLVNLSARGPVGTGASVLIAGFAISGNVPKQVLIRAAGPSLAQFGFSGVLADPQLDLFSGATLVQHNDNWAGAANLAAAFAATGAFSFTSANSRDAALLITLAPGNYTAQVSGVNNSTGTALVEVYEVP